MKNSVVFVILMGMLGIFVDIHSALAQSKIWQEFVVTRHQTFAGGTVPPNIRYVDMTDQGRVNVYGYFNLDVQLHVPDGTSIGSTVTASSYKNAVGAANGTLVDIGEIPFLSSFSTIYFHAVLYGKEYVVLDAKHEEDKPSLRVLNSESGVYEDFGVDLVRNPFPLDENTIIYAMLEVGDGKVLVMGDIISFSGSNGMVSRSGPDDYFSVLWDVNDNSVEKVTYPDGSHSGIYVGHQSNGEESFALSYSNVIGKYHIFHHGGTVWEDTDIPLLPNGRYFHAGRTYAKSPDELYFVTAAELESAPKEIAALRNGAWETILVIENRISPLDNEIQSLVFAGDALYASGSFTHVNGQEVGVTYDKAEIIEYDLAGDSFTMLPYEDPIQYRPRAYDVRLFAVGSRVYLANHTANLPKATKLVYLRDDPPLATPSFEGPEGLVAQNDVLDGGTAEMHVAFVDHYLDGELKDTVEPDDAGAWSVLVEDVPDGSHERYIRTRDLYGKQSEPSAVRTVTIDTHVASPTLLTALDTTIIRGDPLTLRVTGAEEGSELEFFVDGVSVAESAAVAGNGAFSLMPMDLGSHAWYVRITDVAGNTALSETKTFTVSSLLSEPSASGPVNMATANLGDTFTFTVSVPRGTSAVFAFMHGSETHRDTVAVVNGSASTEHQFFGIGVHEWSVHVIDAFGNKSAVMGDDSIILTDLLPSPGVLTPDADAQFMLGETITLEVSVPKGTAVTFMVNGTAQEVSVNNGNAVLMLNPSEAGTISWFAFATDGFGNKSAGTEVRSFFAGRPPVAPTLISPSGGATFNLGREVVIEVAATEGTETLISINDVTEIVPITGGTASVSKTFSETGDVAISAAVRNAAGTQSEWTEFVTVHIIDVLAVSPMLTLADNAPFNLGEEISITAEHAHATTFVFTGGGIQTKTVTAVNGVAVFQATFSSVGSYAVSAYGLDEAGNATTDTTVILEVSNVLDAPTLVSPEDGSSITKGESITFEAEVPSGTTCVLKIACSNGETTDTILVENGRVLTEKTPSDTGVHTVSLMVFDSYGNKSPWVETSFTVESVVSGIGDEEANLLLYPNPAVAGGSVQIENIGRISEVYLSDMTGRTRSLVIAGGRIELPETIVPGNYVLLVKTSHVTTAKRLIVR